MSKEHAVTKEEGVKVGEGEILIDTQAMDRKLSVDSNKLWEHRKALIWKEYGTAINIAIMMIPGGIVGWFCPTTKCTVDSLIIVCVGSVIGFAIIYSVGGFVIDIINHAIVSPGKRIKADWNGNGLSQRLLEKQENKK